MELQFIFRIGRSNFALPAHLVQQTLPEVTAEPVPWMPAFHRGLFAYRGEIIPLLDLQKFLNEQEPHRNAPKPTSILVINTGSTRFATPVESPKFVQVAEAEWPLHPDSSIFPALDRLVADAGGFTTISADRLQIQIIRELQDAFREDAT